MLVRGLQAVGRQRVVSILAVLALAGLVPLLAATPGGAQTLPVITIKKVVTGVVPAGTTFTVDVTCTRPVPTDVGGAASTTTSTTGGTHAAVEFLVPVTFNANGDPTGTNTVSPPSIPGSCTATETVTGGAQSVSYTCALGSGATDTTCSTDQQTVTFGPDSATGGNTTITVTNVFPPPPPAPVIVSPRFTG